MKKRFSVAVATFTLIFMVSGCSHLKSSANASGSLANGGANGASADGANAYAMNGAGGFDESVADGGAASGVNREHNATYYFAFDKSDIQVADSDDVQKQANYLVAHQDAQVRVEGNTDEHGSREYNIALGYRRAQAVARLLEQDGANANQIHIVSYGKEKPADLGHNEMAWAKNRRVNLVHEKG